MEKNTTNRSRKSIILVVLFLGGSEIVSSRVKDVIDEEFHRDVLRDFALLFGFGLLLCISISICLVILLHL